MSYFNTCPICGAHLDPCERCDCKNESHLGIASTEAACEINGAKISADSIPESAEDFKATNKFLKDAFLRMNDVYRIASLSLLETAVNDWSPDTYSVFKPTDIEKAALCLHEIAESNPKLAAEANAAASMLMDLPGVAAYVKAVGVYR